MNNRACVTKYFIVAPLLLLSLTGTAQAEGFFSKFKEDFQKALKGQQPASQPAQNSRLQQQTQRREQAQPTAVRTGTVTKTANMRSGPGTQHAKAGVLPQGTQVEVLDVSGKWYSVRTTVGGQRVSGWVYAPLLTLNRSQTASPAVATQASVPTGRNPTQTAAGTVSYAGYSKEFMPIKDMMRAGDLSGVEKFFDGKETEIRKKSKTDAELLENIGYLRWLERGTLSIDQGNFQNSVKEFSSAETLLDIRQEQSKIEDWGESGVKFLGEFVTGNQELQDYPGEGYERVLMLNYKSIAYLLSGERKAYNVTRRAIDWQNMEKKAFEKKKREAEAKLAEQKQEQKGEKKTQLDSLTDGSLNESYSKYDKLAKSVPSAYVNPFGYYVAGMIQEYESYDDLSLRDNARISYKKALDLNPDSKVLMKAVKDMKNRAPSKSSRLVHVVVADGFVPEKKMLTKHLQSGGAGQSIPVKLTLYEPDKTSVSRIEVQTTRGKRLAELSPVADVEAICMRHQLDMEPFRQLKMVVAVVGSAATNSLLSGLGSIGNAFAKKREEMAAPDMRSWMSLPATIQAARLRLKKGVSKLKIVSYNKSGKVLASKVVDINKNSHDFIYARSLDETMYTYTAEKLWMLAGQ